LDANPLKIDFPQVRESFNWKDRGTKRKFTRGTISLTSVSPRPSSRKSGETEIPELVRAFNPWRNLCSKNRRLKEDLSLRDLKGVTNPSTSKPSKRLRVGERFTTNLRGITAGELAEEETAKSSLTASPLLRKKLRGL